MTAQSIPYALGRSAGRSAAGSGRGPRIVPLMFFTLLVIAVFFSMIFLRIALDRTAFELESFERQIAKIVPDKILYTDVWLWKRGYHAKQVWKREG